MSSSYRQFFALQKEPFISDIKRKEVMVTAALKGVEERIHYALRLGGVAVLTGEIGSGKSTGLRYVIGGLHPSEYRIIYVTASSGSILELYRQILGELGVAICGGTGGHDPADQTGDSGACSGEEDESCAGDRRSQPIAP